MGLKYKQSHEVILYETDTRDELTITNLIRLLLSVSGKQTYLIARNSHEMTDRQLGWVILQHDITIHDMPKTYDEIEIETEAIAYNQFFTFRSFRVFSKGKLVIETLIKFAVVDKEKRQLVRIEKVFVEDYGVEYGTRGIEMKKIKKASLLPHVISYTARYSDIDSNRHVNNAVYVDWLLSSLPLSFLQSHRPKQFSIAYDHEVVYDETVQIGYTIDEQTTYHLIILKDKPAVRCQIDWERVDKSSTR